MVIESVVLPEVFNDGGLNVEVVPVGNPQNCDLKSMIDLEAIKAGTPMLWSVGMGAPLILGPFTLLPDPDPETGKEQRLGHPALVAGDKDPGSGEWVWGKQARISGELRWDESRKQFYIINQSGRYSRHLDRIRWLRSRNNSKSPAWPWRSASSRKSPDFHLEWCRLSRGEGRAKPPIWGAIKTRVEPLCSGRDLGLCMGRCRPRM